MFTTTTYQQRRNILRQQLSSGVVLFLGNPDSPMNYRDHVYPFRQDGSFLYYWGLNQPGLAAIIDLDSGDEYLVGDTPTIMEVIFMGEPDALTVQAEKIGVTKVITWQASEALIKKSRQAHQQIHYLPQYRGDNQIRLAQLLECSPMALTPSVSLIKAIIEQRLYKSADEIKQMSQALEVTKELHLMAMQQSHAGKYEREIVGKMFEIAVRNERQFSYSVIFSVHGEILHNLYYDNVMQDGQLILNDAGVNSRLAYASDITRTFPVNGQFTTKQRDIYQLVYQMQTTAFKMLRPGINYREVHLNAALCAVKGLIELGLMRGDPVAAVAQGAHALFFTHGLGHAIGLDVHDMESLGENYVGYNEEIIRSEQFGLKALRFAKPLQAGLTLTVEPGIYFVPMLIEQWKNAGKFKEFINYQALSAYADFGGIRIEDNIVITATGYDNLSVAIPSEIEAVEAACSQ